MSENSIVLNNVIISFPHLFEAKQYQGKGAFRYSANFILPATYDFAPIMALIAAARLATGLPDSCDTPFSEVKDGPYKGQWSLACYAYEYAPQVVDQAVAPVMDRKLIFAGCVVNAQIDVYGYTNGRGGVSAGLKLVQIVDNSDQIERLDNRQNATEVFAPVGGAPVASAPSGPAGVAPTGVPQGGPAAQPGGPAAQPAAQPGGGPLDYLT